TWSLRLLRVRPVEHRRIRAPASGRPAGPLDDRALARARWSRRLDRRRLESGGVSGVAPQGRRVAAHRVSLAADRAAAFPRADRRSAAATDHVDGRGHRRRHPRAGVSRAARARQAGAESAGMGAHRHRDATGCRARRARPAHDRGGHAGARRPRRADSRKAPLAPRTSRRQLRRVGAAWCFVAPALLVIAVFFFLPVIGALALSFTDFDIYALADGQNLRLVGLRNYARLLQTPLFWKAFGNTLYFVVVGVPVSIIVSFGAALLLHSRLVRFRAFFRTALFAPVVTTLVAVAVVWRYLFHPHYGLLNYVLGRIGIPAVDWLRDPHWAMPAIIVLAVWKNFGYNMIILLAGLQSIPEQLYEAARIDGAPPWRQFRHVTLPMLAPIVTMVSILTI